MTGFLLALGSLLAAAVATLSTPSASDARASTWSRGVTDICARALLFEGRHDIGTRAGAVAVARDIHASTAGRVRRIRALEVTPPQLVLSHRWLRLEQRLADLYGSTYVRIYEAIAAARTPRERAQLPRLLRRLVHTPDLLRQETRRLELRLLVPDCTGGDTPSEPSQMVIG